MLVLGYIWGVSSVFSSAAGCCEYVLGAFCVFSVCFRPFRYILRSLSMWIEMFYYLHVLSVCLGAF
ncbi:hypothetical protein E2C01_010341 [Portunus trituberculatus]|uniref:Uncharacterized protein n=1 Tax=Portunus trituberculatus TaxID=210409 RepID=A0A5B7D8D0_PORTR|nr:hypothetical protein [Portunus trituberculatus]